MTGSSPQSSFVLRASGYARMRWKNGAGWTSEILKVHDSEERDTNDWAWRLSIAEIETDAPFSAFPGVERELWHPLALRMGDDRESPVVRDLHDRPERRGVQHRTGVGVERDLDDGCPERRLLVDRRRRAPRNARVGRGRGDLAGDLAGRPVAPDRVSARRREERRHLRGREGARGVAEAQLARRVVTPRPEVAGRVDGRRRVLVEREQTTQADLDLVPADTDDDGSPDYVTLSSLQPFNFFGINCEPGGTPTEYDQIWLPLAREDNGDLSVVGDLDGDGVADPELLWGPKLFLGAPGPSVLEVPTLSRLGVAFLALALLALGVQLLRRRPAAGA